MDLKRDDPAAHYEIVVEGELDAGWSESFSGMSIELESLDGLLTSTLAGPVADQAALRGMLCKLWDLNLTLIRVRRVGAPAQEHEGVQDD